MNVKPLIVVSFEALRSVSEVVDNRVSGRLRFWALAEQESCVSALGIYQLIELAFVIAIRLALDAFIFECRESSRETLSCLLGSLLTSEIGISAVGSADQIRDCLTMFAEQRDFLNPGENCACV